MVNDAAKHDIILHYIIDLCHHLSVLPPDFAVTCQPVIQKDQLNTKCERAGICAEGCVHL